MPPDVARVLVLGRLLLVGALGGAVVGLVCGVTLTLVTGDVRAWGGWAAALAASLGLVAGPLAQAVTAIVVLRSGGTGPVARGAAVVVPALLALGLSLAVLSRLSTSQPGAGDRRCGRGRHDRSGGRRHPRLVPGPRHAGASGPLSPRAEPWEDRPACADVHGGRAGPRRVSRSAAPGAS